MILSRYYYAIVECDTVEAASHIYNELEGTELERSANVFDLSFVPDDMVFDAEPRYATTNPHTKSAYWQFWERDEAAEDVTTDYKPVDYVTDVSSLSSSEHHLPPLHQALRHSKVKLTWDDDDPERYQVTRRQLTRQEIEEADFRAYVASSSSEDEEESPEGTATRSKKDKEASRQKLRALLLGGNGGDALPEGWDNDNEGSDVDMEITFTPGLSEKKDEGDETTLEKYQRKMREKRKKKKEERKEREKTKDAEKEKKGKGEPEDDEFFDFGNGSEGGGETETTRDIRRKKNKKQKSDAQHSQTPPPRKESTAEELALIAASDNVDDQEPKHFNMKAVLKAERRKGKNGRKGKRHQEENELQEDFKIDVDDERFRVLHEDHQFAIDPTNPQYVHQCVPNLTYAKFSS